MSENKAIVVRNLHKTFRLPHESHSGLKQMLLNLFKKNRKKGYETQHVLKGINFEIEEGDFFGIIGRNGSGKSTLLKLLAGIYTPDSGEVKVNGSLVPFIELGVGFNPELTGRENIFLNGALLGFSEDEMEKMYDDIVEFAELERFMDQRLKNYSSGMQVRLAFSIAIRARGDILLLDEVLAVGDEAFQRKCFDYFGSLKRDKKTVILVTHDMGSIEKFCNKALLIEGGEIVELGRSVDVARSYQNLLIEDETIAKNKYEKIEKPKGLITNPKIKSVNFNILQFNKTTSSIKHGSDFTIRLHIDVGENIKGVYAVNVVNSQGAIVLGLGVGGYREPEFILDKGVHEVDFTINNILTNDTYFINATIGVYDELNVSRIAYQEVDITSFISRGVRTRAYAIIQPKIQYSYNINKSKNDNVKI